MPLIERYVLRRVARLFLATLGALLATIWLTQVLRELDVVTTKGQALWVFVVMTLLALPALLQVVAPLAFLVAVLATLNRLTSDSELPVIAAAGASRRAVNRPVLVLAVAVTLAGAFSYHFAAPASLSALRGMLTRVTTSVIATLVREGGFRTVSDGLTVHIRERAPDGSFRGIFISDDRDPGESVQSSAESGMLLERPGSAFLVLQKGDLIREDRLKGSKNVVGFETYAIDLSQLGANRSAARLKIPERSTLYLLMADPADAMIAGHAEDVTAEIHDRMSAPLYILAFAFVSLGFVGAPRTNRHDRSFAIAAVVLVCLGLRAVGFAAAATASSWHGAAALLYPIPMSGIALGAYLTIGDRRPRMPQAAEAIIDRIAVRATELAARFRRADAGVAAGSR